MATVTLASLSDLRVLISRPISDDAAIMFYQVYAYLSPYSHVIIFRPLYQVKEVNAHLLDDEQWLMIRQ